MVVKPEDVRALSKEDEATLRSLEQMIDQKLMEANIDPSKGIAVKVGLLPYKIRNNILNRYSFSGWSIENSDGENWTFSEKKAENVRDMYGGYDR